MSKTKAAASNKAAATTTRVPYSKPLLRRSLWRESIVDTLLAHVPARFGRFIDPFVGRAELFFALAPKEAILSDNNPEVINLYQQVAHNVDALLTHLKSYEHSEECYKRLCAQRFVDLEPAEAAARTLYLNKNCFHGVYRVDNEGVFSHLMATICAVIQLMKRPYVMPRPYCLMQLSLVVTFVRW